MPVPGVFDDKVCEVVLPPSSRKRVMEIRGRSVPDLQGRSGLIPRHVKVAFIGDTGCRVTQTHLQNCKSRSEWPLRDVLQGVAASGSDFVVHVGDYVYREEECSDDSKCDKGIYGDKSATWAMDLLEPLQTISDKLPFVFVRGNHEDCSRAHSGWFRYIDAFPMPAIGQKCEDVTSPWLISLSRWNMGGDEFYVMDSASTPDEVTKEHNVDIAHYREMFSSGFGGVGEVSRLWLLTHKPLWAYSSRMGKPYYGDFFQVLALGPAVMQRFTGVISGHVHAGQLLQVSVPDGSVLSDGGSVRHQASGHIIQVISGNAGSSLYSVGDNSSFAVGGYTVSDVRSVSGFGFCTLTIPPPSYYERVISVIVGHRVSVPTVTLHNVRGEVLAECSVER
ncbi:metallophosphoesterase [Candidatus Anaplasma sp. TIGMIC]|uniref:metallophosphoesterase n=1 Tax=Candidatus Anaplasma sp. TIGMIC TaxID=3020713 RepID=UPI00232F7677|nr:metallophosphoesterase [Candidatus Anaplasma sp. TIGMIC]MDB1135432.1 metallophosphoesterase [Candidatus Anaplasma sp. TIGMIC]